MNLLLHKAPQISDSALELPSQFFTREGVKLRLLVIDGHFLFCIGIAGLIFLELKTTRLKLRLSAVLLIRHQGCQLMQGASTGVIYPLQ